MTHRTTVARAVYTAACLLARVKTRQRFRRVVSFRPLTTVPAGRRWAPCRASTKLMMIAARTDPGHWDHWALDHGAASCGATTCPDCGGLLCGGTDDDLPV